MVFYDGVTDALRFRASLKSTSLGILALPVLITNVGVTSEWLLDPPENLNHQILNLTGECHQ